MGVPLLASLLLLQLLACASGDNCPPKEDIYPCRCKPSNRLRDKIDLDCDQGSVEDTKAALHQFRGKAVIDTLYIRKVNGDWLPSNLFLNISVKVVVIQDCDLHGIIDSDGGPVFLDLANNLEVLQVTRSIKGANSLKTLDLSYLKRLYNLILTGNNIPEVGNDWFAEGPLSLRVLVIENSGLSKVGETAFAPLANLELLSLTVNRLTAFGRSMIPHSDSHVRYLGLGGNPLIRLPEDIFSAMPSLHVILLGKISLKRIEEKTWASVWANRNNDLQVYLFENPLECDSHMEWLFSLLPPRNLMGTCESPLSLKGLPLEEFIRSNRKLLNTN